MRRALSLFFNFFPLSIFITYAMWDGPPDGERWGIAYQVGAIASIFQLLLITRNKKPINRLILAANLYLLAGGLAAFFEFWSFFAFYEKYQESAVLFSMLVVGVFTTLLTRSGFIGVSHENSKKVLLYSMLLIAATLACCLLSYFLRGNTVQAGVLPVLCLSLLSRYLSSQLNTA